MDLFSCRVLSLRLLDHFKIRRECEISTANHSPVSTGLLNRLPYLHVQPINLIVFQGAFVLRLTNPYLGEGFTLRCFQRLSFP